MGKLLAETAMYSEAYLKDQYVECGARLKISVKQTWFTMII